MLKNKSHAPLTGRHSVHVDAVKDDSAYVGRLKTCYDPQQRALAATAGPEQGHQLACLYLKAHTVNGDKVAEPLAHVLNADTHITPGVWKKYIAWQSK
jgi:hypothetical protein